MTIRALIDDATHTHSYLIFDPETKHAALVDPVIEQIDRDLALVSDLGLELRFALDTHIHADHVTAAGALAERTGAKTARSAAYGPGCADLELEHGQALALGTLTIAVRATPGHTVGCLSFVVSDAEGRVDGVLTGDALLVRGTGRTDFQGGDPRALFRSIHDELYTLPDDTIVYPGHDYRGHLWTTIAEEKRLSPRIPLGRSQDEFVRIMTTLHLPPPARIASVVPANLRCGRAAPADVAEGETT